MPKQFESEDLCLYERIPDLCGSPATDLIACTVERVDRDANTYRSAIWCYPASGGTPRQLTAGTSLDNSPNWAPDGKRLAFVSKDDDGNLQVFLIDRDGGERRQLTHLLQHVVSLVWSPEGERMLVTVSVASDPVSHSGAATQVANGGPEIVWRLPYKRDGLGYVLNQQVHLYVVDANTGDATQLTSGPFDVHGMAWSPDGKSILYARTRDERCAHRTDIWRMDADGSDARQISNDVATAQFPSWSPDGRTMVFSGAAHEGDAQVRLWTFDCATGKVRCVDNDIVDVVDGGSVTWDDDSGGVVLIAARRGMREVGHISLPHGAYRTLAGGHRHVSALSVTSGQRLAFTAESPREPNQLFACAREGGSETQLSHRNAWWYERPQPRVQLRTFDVPDGDGGTEPVQGWVIGPDGDHRPGPLLVDLHGGPASYALLAYTSHPYWNALVSRGWTVLALNAVGSSSYGYEFSKRLRGRWGELDLHQHLAAADELHRTGEVDGRLAVAGKSYGGYAAAWAIATTTRFRAAVISAPITNLETHYGTSDSGYYADPYDMMGEPMPDRENYLRPSPAQYADRVRTPVLVINGKEDQRCPVGQAEDFFVRVMRTTATPAEMVLYPGGDHHVYESGPPSQRVDVMTRMVNWLERWIAKPLAGVD
jgi:dipeptidyl aminopeptidase/acylaminoacyl peptidase